MQDTNYNNRPLSVGIMTFHWAHNYGAILQLYALYQYLRQVLHLDVRLINFTTDRQEKVNYILPKIQWSKQLPKTIGILLLKSFHYVPLKRRKSRFEQFLQENFVCTRLFRDINDLCANPPLFDAVVTGSDQVFNYRILPEKELLAYCLAPFSKETRKIAFAPSFGCNSVPSEVLDKMAVYLKDFQSLSAREIEGALFLEQVTSMSVKVLFDPVFLHEAELWRALSRPLKVPSSYILCYALNGRRSLGDLATKIKTLTNLPIVLVTSNVHSCIEADKIFYDAGPREFLWLIDKAQYVITDSFHGTAFAFLFEKNFFTHVVVKQSAQRLIGLLNKLGQESRLAEKAQDITTENLTIDFSGVRPIIAEERLKSRAFLKKSLL